MFKRVFLIILDGLGVGYTEDSNEYGDLGSNTLGHIIENKNYNLRTLEKLGFFNIVGNYYEKTRGYHGKIAPLNEGKNSLNGHYEIMGVNTKRKYSSYPDGLPLELISEIQNATGREVIGNINASDMDIINELGEMHIKTGALILYTSSDSVIKVTAHESIIDPEDLFTICKIIRELTNNETYNISRVVAKPFTGKLNDFSIITSKRKDFTVDPPKNCLDLLYKNDLEVIALGKIGDLFNNRSITKSIKTFNNLDGLMKLIDVTKSDFKGLCALNLNDFDSIAHTRNKDTYYKSLEDFDNYLPIFLNKLTKDDLVIFTSDHGNDPTFHGRDHTRENLPLVIFSKRFTSTGVLYDRNTLSDVSATILDNFNITNVLTGESILKELE